MGGCASSWRDGDERPISIPASMRTQSSGPYRMHRVTRQMVAPNASSNNFGVDVHELLHHFMQGRSVDDELRSALVQTMDDGAQMEPASQNVIAALPTHSVTEGEIAAASEEHRSCCVCLEDFKEGDEQRTLPCFHRFHKCCVDTWLQQSGACPICKHRVDA